MTPRGSAGTRRRLAVLAASIGSMLAAIATFAFLRKRPRHVEDELSGRGAPGIPPSPEAGASGHETEDMSGRTMMWVLSGLGGMAAIAIVLMVLLTGLFGRERDAATPRFTTEQTRVVETPKPNLQIDPGGDISRLQEHEHNLLDHYAWADAKHARARIPIARAIALSIGRNLDPAP